MTAVSITPDRRVAIDLCWLLNALSPEQKREVVDSLSCEDTIIEDVTAQLLVGWTEASSCGAKSMDAGEPSTPLSRARRKIAVGASALAAEEISDLVRQLKWQKQLADHYRDIAFDLQRAWPEDFWRTMPWVPQIPLGDPNLYAVTKIGGGE